jgi:predicted nucleotidyltransferase
VTAEEALDRLSPRERQWVEEFHDRVRDLLGSRLRDVRLFGSKARGDAHPESDIDLLVLVEHLDPAEAEEIVVAAYLITPWLVPVVRDFDEYHAPISRATGFYKELREESVRL